MHDTDWQDDPAYDLEDEGEAATFFDAQLQDVADGWVPVNPPRWEGEPDEYPAVVNQWGECTAPRPGDGTLQGQLVGAFVGLGLSLSAARIAARGR